jgi:hypothetical protein
MADKINTGPKTIGEASKLALAELLLKAAKNPKSEITMDDYNYYIETGKLNFANGGMASINDMIRPIGMAAGGPIPPEEPKIRPKEKPVNFKAIMAEFDTPENRAGPGEPVGIEKIIADEFAVDPRFTMKQRIKEMLGMGGDQGSASSLSREELEGLLKSLNISLMLAQETGSFLGGGNAEKIKELENQIRQIELELLK